MPPGGRPELHEVAEVDEESVRMRVKQRDVLPLAVTAGLQAVAPVPPEECQPVVVCVLAVQQFAAACPGHVVGQPQLTGPGTLPVPDRLEVLLQPQRSAGDVQAGSDDVTVQPGVELSVGVPQLVPVTVTSLGPGEASSQAGAVTILQRLHGIGHPLLPLLPLL